MSPHSNPYIPTSLPKSPIKKNQIQKCTDSLNNSYIPITGDRPPPPFIKKSKNQKNEFDPDVQFIFSMSKKKLNCFWIHACIHQCFQSSNSNQRSE